MRPPPRPKATTLAVGGFVLAHGAVLLAISVAVYRSGNVSLDYAILNQAWFLVAHGHLNPASTLYQTTFLDQHGELVIWVLAPLYWLDPNQGFTLQLIQVLGIEASIAIAASWLLAFGARHGCTGRQMAGPLVVFLILIAANPWIYAVAYEDVHLEAIGVALALAAGRDLYVGRTGRAVLWVTLGLLAGDVAASYLVLAGLTIAAVDSGHRRRGLLVAGAALVWFVGLGAVGADAGTPITGYAYLAGRDRVPSGVGGQLRIVAGTLVHPDRAIRHLWHSRQGLGHTLLPAGLAGVADPLVVFVAAIVLLTNALNVEPLFATEPFQNLVVYVFASLGTAALLARGLARGSGRAGVRWLAGAAVVASLVVAVTYDGPRLDGAPVAATLPSGAGGQLARARAAVPSDAEVVSSYGVVGRFSSRSQVYALIGANAVVPVVRPLVAFVLAPGLGVHQLPGLAGAESAYVAGRLHAHPAFEGTDVVVYLWRPPADTRSIEVP